MEQGGGPVHAKRRASRSMQQRGPIHANPGQHALTLNTFSPFLHQPTFCRSSYYCMPFPALQLPLYTHRYSLTISPSFCFVACALYTIVVRFILANSLLLNQLCCILESRPSYSSMQSITCFDVAAGCRTHILWIHHLCSYASCSALRPWKTTQLSY